jgi:very-short-patch-repair endonuclease
VLDATILSLAARRHGVLSVRELIALGVSRAAISRARRTGKVVDLTPGAIRLASAPDGFLARCHAIDVRLEGRGFISGWTAGRLMGLRSMPSETIHVTVRSDDRRSFPDWVEAHPSRWLDDDRERWINAERLCIASPLRMLWGLAAEFNQFRFERAAEDAWHRKLITPAKAADYLERHRCRGKDGVQRLERWLDGALARARPTQSNLERRLIERLLRLGLPPPRRQHPVELPSGEFVHLDVAWPDVLLAVEPGASWWHGGDLAMRRDQARDRACSELGWLILRFDETMAADLDAAASQVARVHRHRTRTARSVARS